MGAALSEPARRPAAEPLDLVLDLGKTRSKLLVLTRQGDILAQAETASSTCSARLGTGPDAPAYSALDTEATAAWLASSLASLGPLRPHLLLRLQHLQ